MALAMALGLDHEALVALEKRLQQGADVSTCDDNRSASPATALEQAVAQLALLDHVAPDRKDLHELPMALVDDPRALLVKLVKHLATLQRAIASPGLHDKALAQRALHLYGPLAGRLGVYQLKWRIEDLGFRILDPESYYALARSVRERRAEREARIDKVQAMLSHALDQARLPHHISGRSKHLYSIHSKMQRKARTAETLLDLSALRILVDDVEGCYRALAIVHALLPPLHEVFKDYIVAPKANGYRSLHTVVMAAAVPDGAAYPVEIQIRTHQMHREAELGVAAHWLYKENRASAQQQRVNALRTLIEQSTAQQAQQSDIAPQALAPIPRADVFCLTPRGDVIRLAPGATVVDFAYAIHTEIGHRCRGALVNGAIVPLHHLLKTGDRVEILTRQHSNPNREWMRSGNPFVRTRNALAKVRAYFRRLDETLRRARGQDILTRTLRRLRMEALTDDQLLGLGVTSQQELALALGENKLSSAFVIERLRPRGPSPTPSHAPVVSTPGKALVVVASTLQGLVRLEGQAAGCCHPRHGEPIIGYLAVKGGIMVHRRACRTIQQAAQRRPERLLNLSWPT